MVLHYCNSCSLPMWLNYWCMCILNRWGFCWAELHLFARRSISALTRGSKPRAVGTSLTKNSKTGKKRVLRACVTLADHRPGTTAVLSLHRLSLARHDAPGTYRLKKMATSVGNDCGLAGAHGGNGAGSNPRGLPKGFRIGECGCPHSTAHGAPAPEHAGKAFLQITFLLRP